MSKITESVDDYINYNPDEDETSRLPNHIKDSYSKAELESLCRQCGLCCHTKARLSDGSCVIHPTETCQYLGEDNKCTIYHERFKINPDCLALDKILAKDYVVPEGCPYAELKPGYKASRVVSPEEFNRILAYEELIQSLNSTNW